MKQWILKAVSICLMLGMNSAFAAKEQTVVLVSIDGLRWDYIEKHGAKFKSNGRARCSRTKTNTCLSD